MHKGDVVMADRGFLIRDQLAKVEARSAMPHFLSDKGHFSLQDVNKTKQLLVCEFMWNDTWNS